VLCCDMGTPLALTLHDTITQCKYAPSTLLNVLLPIAMEVWGRAPGIVILVGRHGTLRHRPEETVSVRSIWLRAPTGNETPERSRNCSVDRSAAYRNSDCGFRDRVHYRSRSSGAAPRVDVDSCNQDPCWSVPPSIGHQPASGSAPNPVAHRRKRKPTAPENNVRVLLEHLGISVTQEETVSVHSEFPLSKFLQKQVLRAVPELCQNLMCFGYWG